jgi:hypothetical protein
MAKKKPTKAAPMVVVRWHDHSMSADAHWHDGDQPPVPKPRDGLCVSVGFLTHMDDQWVQIVQTLTPGQHGSFANLKRECVESVDVLMPIGPLED